MSLAAVRSWLQLPVVALVVAFVLFTPVIEGATAPHTHTESGPGLYNADCPLAVVARLSGSAPVPDALPTLSNATVHAPVVVAATELPESEPSRHAGPRAPPSLVLIVSLG
jgi:hypothetical protein